MDYFDRAANTDGHGASNPQPQTPSAFPPMTPLGTPLQQQVSARSSRYAPSPSRPRGPPSVRLRRLPSKPTVNENGSRPTSSTLGILQEDYAEPSSRRRSSSAPQRPSSGLSDRRATQQPPSHLPALAEESSNPQYTQPSHQSITTRNRATSNAASSAAEHVLNRPRRSSSASRPLQRSQNYERDVVDLLDVVDPEVSTLTTLNNLQNSLVVPNLGRYFNRQPTYDLSQRPDAPRRQTARLEKTQSQLQRQSSKLSRVPSEEEAKRMGIIRGQSNTASIFGAPLRNTHSIASVMSESNYAVLPHGVVLEGWTDEDKEELNDYVRHLLHSRRAKFKRSMRGFGKYVRTPLGAFVTIYSFLITFWGAAWVLFIIGWLSVAGRQKYFIEICDQVLTALFCVVGIGLAPFRAVDTYHMYFIEKYHRKTLRLRKEQGLKHLEDENELPDISPEGDIEALPTNPEDAVLSEDEQKIFHHHQAKFSKSHTYYRPHQTLTHRAFSIDLLIVVVVLLDCHSIFQMALGGTTWGIYYRRRPKALTAVILTCSICCNISGGITISIGDKKTRKKEVVERIFRQALTEEALHTLEKKKGITAISNEEAVEHTLAKLEGKESIGGEKDARNDIGEKPAAANIGESMVLPGTGAR